MKECKCSWVIDYKDEWICSKCRYIWSKRDEKHNQQNFKYCPNCAVKLDNYKSVDKK